MPTWHMEVNDWGADPEPTLKYITEQDEKCGAYARAAYQWAQSMFATLIAPAAISGGVLPLADGSDSVVVTVSAHVGAPDGRTYRDRVMEYLKGGPDAHETQPAPPAADQ